VCFNTHIVARVAVRLRALSKIREFRAFLSMSAKKVVEIGLYNGVPVSTTHDFFPDDSKVEGYQRVWLTDYESASFSLAKAWGMFS
jgi:hypothetical protein